MSLVVVLLIFIHLNKNLFHSCLNRFNYLIFSRPRLLVIINNSVFSTAIDLNILFRNKFLFDLIAGPHTPRSNCKHDISNELS